jgi:hypothetical protein
MFRNYKRGVQILWQSATTVIACWLHVARTEIKVAGIPIPTTIT